MEENVQPQVVVVEKKGNGMGTAGFVLALLGLIFCWVPVLDWILWLLGLIFSIVGLFKPKKGLAIAGLIISFIYLILIFAVLGAVMASM
ncbi:MAG: hypothetical protein K2G21_02160 [Muribaculaceae bacterium]|nr:hypothetical protein [Muribaculaceae bacterium]